MDGFAEGVAYYNKQKSKDVKVVGWNTQTQTGSSRVASPPAPTAKQRPRP